MEHATLFGMTWADYAIIGIILFSVIISLIRGFVREALSLANWVIAFWVALKFSDSLSSFLITYINTPSLRIVASFGFIFIFALIIGCLISFLISRLIISTGLSGMDRMLGLIFGLIRGILLIGVIILLLSFTAFAQDDWYKNSALIPHFHPLITWLKGFLPETMNQISSLISRVHHL